MKHNRTQWLCCVYELDLSNIVKKYLNVKKNTDLKSIFNYCKVQNFY